MHILGELSFLGGLKDIEDSDTLENSTPKLKNFASQQRILI